jgi:hypothetical protein
MSAPDRLFEETVAERLAPTRTRLVEDVIKAKGAIEKAQEKARTAEDLLAEFDGAMEQLKEQEAHLLFKPRVDLTTGELLD